MYSRSNFQTVRKNAHKLNKNNSKSGVSSKTFCKKTYFKHFRFVAIEKNDKAVQTHKI